MADNQEEAHEHDETAQVVIAYRLDIDVEAVERQIRLYLLEHFRGQSVVLTMKSDYGNPETNAAVDEELGLYETLFTPWWIWDEARIQHVRILPDDRRIPDLDDTDFAQVEYDWNANVVVQESRVTGPQWLVAYTVEDTKAIRATERTARRAAWAASEAARKARIAEKRAQKG